MKGPQAFQALGIDSIEKREFKKERKIKINHKL